MKALTMTVAAVVLAGGAAAQEATLDAAALAEFVTGRSYTGVNPETGAPVATVTYAPDGSSVLTFPDGRAEAGSWRLDGDVYCTRYAAFRDNSENCFRVAAMDGGAGQAWYADGRKALILQPAE